MDSGYRYLSVVFNLKSVMSISMMKEEEQNFKEMIESEYRISFQLMIEENMVNLQGLQRYVFNLNLREANQNQPMQFATELREKFQEILQVRCGK